MALHNNPVSQAHLLNQRVLDNGIVEKPEDIVMKAPWIVIWRPVFPGYRKMSFKDNLQC